MARHYLVILDIAGDIDLEGPYEILEAYELASHKDANPDIKQVVVLTNREIEYLNVMLKSLQSD